MDELQSNEVALERIRHACESYTNRMLAGLREISSKVTITPLVERQINLALEGGLIQMEMILEKFRKVTDGR